MPRESFPAGVRTTILQHVSDFVSNAATVSADFNANTLATIRGGSAGYPVQYKCQVEAIEFDVATEDFVGGGGTLTFELRKGSATGSAIASITIPLASALRGATIRSAVTAANAEIAKLKDGDLLFLVRLATGTAFTTGRGVFRVIGWQKPQSRL